MSILSYIHIFLIFLYPYPASPINVSCGLYTRIQAHILQDSYLITLI